MPPSGTLPEAAGLFDSAPCGLLLTDPNGMIRKVNATFCAWSGFAAERLVGQRRFQDLFTIGGRVFHQTHLAPLLQMQGSVAEVTLDLRHADGHLLPVLFNILRRPHGDGAFDEIAVFLASDRRKYEHELLLARKNAEASLEALAVTQKALQESRDFLGIAMRGARMGVWARDLASGAVWFSAELEALAGLGEGGFGGTADAFYALVHPDDLQAFKDTIAQALALVRDCSVQFRLRHGDGHWTAMEAHVRPACDASGTPITLCGIAINIDERQRDAERLRELNAQLALADRKKDEFLATLAHELRNPLAPLRNVLEILKLKASDDPQLVWAREVFERQMGQMSHLVDDLMEISRITQGRVELRRESVDLAAVMQGAVEASAAAVAAGGHKLIVELPAPPLTLDADPTRLTQILTNLLNNAAKYTPDGGHIWFSARCEDGAAVLTVRDSGIGIAADNLVNVFTMFAQLEPALERAQGGLGIGLALVKGLVELHGGTIRADSGGVGQGSEFTVRLPLPALPAVSVAAAQPSAPASVASAATRHAILVVDDNRDAADMLRMALEMLRYEAACVYDGAAALDICAGAMPDAIVLDIGLPGMDGYEVARRIRAQPSGAHVMLVAATGWGQQRDREAALAAGFDHHLVKPVDFVQLDALLRAA